MNERLNNFYVPIILGTAREGRESEKAAKFVLQEAIKYGLKNTEIIDVRDFRIKATDNTLKTAGSAEAIPKNQESGRTHNRDA